MYMFVIRNCCCVMFNATGVHPLSQPGTADLSAWVDFSAMRMAAEQAAEAEQATAAAAAAGRRGAAAAPVAEQAAAAAAAVDVHGPVAQADLLHSLGIQHRLEALAQVGLLQGFCVRSVHGAVAGSNTVICRL
jgi:SAM-dependent MidA family methyltransferase